MVLSAKNLATWMTMLEFDRFVPPEAAAAFAAAEARGAAAVAAAEARGDAAAAEAAAAAAVTVAKNAPFDIRINGLGVDALVSQVARRARKRRTTPFGVKTTPRKTYASTLCSSRRSPTRC